MVAGRVVRFDSSRGYGFIAPEGGGEDVFLHVNDLLIPEEYVRPGLVVEFDVEDGERGPKASDIRLAEGVEPGAPRRPGAASRPALPDESGQPMCDVLSAAEYRREVTELLLNASPSLTAEQILGIRAALVKFSESHGWVED
ncbi:MULTISPECIES: cold-shock protein [Streptomyces]|uniref:Cold shock domain-containing protein n=1 Tax=Streptomyces lavenduligriseus TaxID=67315 RepID=A0ABT0P0B2_9ACTN|nr:cold shock domain-containing protein [Streptomyces lavenduligriseus]MCL3997159.1 cold shock domain-containing protein [Streptomyces lavenduligriseus]WDM10499.1 cold shock domain-containing protein [Streptomyces lavenduligriseus]